MGWGDELMAAGQAKELAERLDCKVVICAADGSPRWSPVWDNLPFLERQAKPGVQRLVNGPGARPYIGYPFTDMGHGYTDWRARDHRPVIALSAAEEAHGVSGTPFPFVYIESTIKPGANVNKRWPHWQKVVDMLPRVQFVQCGRGDEPILRGATWIRTQTFREACGVLSRARAYAGPEGGMHHAAAALNVPAAVVFGGSPSVEATGYPDHVNFAGVAGPCGRWLQCEHCRRVMAGIHPEDVATAIAAIVQRSLSKGQE